MFRKLTRFLSIVLTVVMTLSVCFLNNVNVIADSSEKNTNSIDKDSTIAYVDDYYTYLNSFSDDSNITDSISVELDSYSAMDSEVLFSENVLKWEKGEGEVTFRFSVQKKGFYNIGFLWKPIESGLNIKMGVKIDGEYSFMGMSDIVLTRAWKNAADEPRHDAVGNEFAQEQIEIDDYIYQLLKDSNGVVLEPYAVYFEEGVHTLTLLEPKQSILIKEINLVGVCEIPSYEQKAADYTFEINEKATPIVLQGESANIKSSNSLVPKSNNSDAGMKPTDAFTSKINYIGSTAWQAPGQYLTWNFSVEHDGYYAFDLRYKQSDLINGDSLRRLMIDGEIPFEEAKQLRFPYGTKWENYVFSDVETNPYYIWLDKGEHTLTLEVTMGTWSEYFRRLAELVDVLGDTYINIVMITSESPDVNRDYELFNQIPNFNDTLKECYDKLTQLAEDMKASTGKRSSQCIGAIDNMNRVLNSMLKNPYVAQHYVTDYYTNYTSLSSWLYDMKNMPLSVDEIRLVPYGTEITNDEPGFFEEVWFSAVRFISSFIKDYSTNHGSDNTEKSIRLWVNWGPDQASILSSLVEDSFTAEKGIKVDLEIVNASLINGLLAGNYPDLVLHLSRTEPVNLGIRGALYDLYQFEDCNDVLSRFQTGAHKPYEYNDKLYAIPDTQGFFIMFYRTDIFENLQLSVPNTWDEFKHAATVIQRNNMNVYLPYTSISAATTVNLGVGNLNMFATLMAQKNLSLYNNELTATAWNTEEALDVFEDWTSFYKEYGFIKEAEFYNRFRSGLMPLGIAPYSTYMTLYAAAPEIQDRWSIALVPGYDENNRTIADGGTGCAVVAASDNRAEAWEFLKWWTSTETQSRYSKGIESMLGLIGRNTSANVEAMRALTWEPEHLEVIMQAWSNVEAVPEVPGSYYLVRALDQAYWDVINGTSRTKDAVIKWGRIADDEIIRKINDYS